MNRITAGILGLLLALTPFAFASQAFAATSWDVTGNYVVAFEYLGGTYAHDVSLAQDPLDNITGSGGHPAGGAHVYTWVINDGSVSGDSIEFYADYTATADAVLPQTTMHVVGEIAPDGSMSGTWSDNYQGGARSGTWETTSGSANQSSNTVIVTGNTTAVENTPGWMFGRDVANQTPFHFTTDEWSTGDGSLYVEPIGSTSAAKFIGENFINVPIADVNSISYDFKIGAGGVDTEEEQFYMNVYANFGVSDDLKYYDCRYEIVPTTGSTAGFTTVTFDPTQAYPVTTRGSSPFACPAIPADMDGLSPGSNIRMFALNVGDTSNSDEGLDGYLDKVVTNTDSVVTVYDFEDEDGVIGGDDLCPGTVQDTWGAGGLGTNRWELGEGNVWFQNIPGKKGAKVYTPMANPTIKDTYGCSGEQIIDLVSNLTDEDMNGHREFGLSTGLLETFIEDGADGVIDGINAEDPLETVTVPATATSGITSTTILALGSEYVLRASGTADAADGIIFDADYSYRNPTSLTWTDSVNNYESYGPILLDLKVDDTFVDWDDDAVYNPDHTYNLDFVGLGAPVSFGVYDVAPENNDGVLTVDIFAKLW